MYKGKHSGKDIDDQVDKMKQSEIFTKDEKEKLKEVPKLGEDVDNIYNILSEQQELFAWYTIIDEAIASPTNLEQGGNLDLAARKPFSTGAKRCMQKGTKIEYLDPADSTKFEDGTDVIYDGTEGDMMVHFTAQPRFKVEDITPEGSTTKKWKIWTTPYDLPGFKTFHQLGREVTVGVAFAQLDRTNLRLISGLNMTANYRGGNNNATYDDTFKSFLGMPVTNVANTTLLDYARKNNSYYGVTEQQGSYGYISWQTHCMLWLIYMSEEASLDSQTGIIGTGPTCSGTEWNNHNGYYPFLRGLQTLSLGNKSGIVNVEIDWVTEGAKKTFPVHSFCGVELVQGYLWEFVQNVLLEHFDGTLPSKAYITNDNRKFAWSKNYFDREVDYSPSLSEGYIKNMVIGADLDLFVKDFGGASNQRYCDYWWNQNAGIRIVIRGVAAFNGSYCGLSGVNGGYGVGYAWSDYGCRLEYNGEIDVVADLSAQAQ